jgi:hypothetical protein
MLSLHRPHYVSVVARDVGLIGGTDLSHGPKKCALIGHTPLRDRLTSPLRSLQGCAEIMNGRRLELDGHW